MSKTSVQIDSLWSEFRKAINSTYEQADKSKDENGICLRDYAENVSWSDSLARLLDRETANEKAHRSGRPAVSGFSARTAAKLILLGNAAEGSNAANLPSATAFLVLRQTAVEAQVIGFLSRSFLSSSWRESIKAFDYAKLMKVSA